MAQDIVGSLFGPTPEELQRQRQEQQAILGQNAAKISPSYGLGYNVGTLIGQGLGALFGNEDPALAKAAGIRKVLQETQTSLGDDAANPAILFPTLQKNLSEAGYSEEAFMAAGKAQEYDQTARMYASPLARLQRDRRLAVSEGTPEEVAQLDEQISLLNEGSGKSYKKDPIYKQYLKEFEADPNAEERALEKYNEYKGRKPTKGYMIDPETLDEIPLPGGKIEKDLKEAEKAKTTRLNSIVSKLTPELNNIKVALNMISPETVGSVFAVGASKIPGTPAYDLRGVITSLKAAVSFNSLQEMRDNSKTGGALGNVSNVELELLANSIAALDQGLSPELLRDSLNKIQTRFQYIFDLANEELGNENANPPSTENQADTQTNYSQDEVFKEFQRRFADEVVQEGI